MYKSGLRKLSVPLSVLLGCVAVYLISDLYERGLSNVGIVTGWLLFSVVFFQSFYQGRKFEKIRVGTSSVWLGCHVCMGLLSLVLFMFHVGWRIPNGVFEVIFTIIYLGTVLSGITGLYIYRSLPRRFLETSEELTFQRIPQRIRMLRREAEKIALSSVEESRASLLAEYYNDYLARFFLRPNFLLRHVVRPSQKNLRDISHYQDLIGRVLNKEEKEKVAQLVELARQKNKLDYQYTLKYVIKAWVFIHAPLAFATMILMIMHTLIVYAYMS